MNAVRDRIAEIQRQVTSQKQLLAQAEQDATVSNPIFQKAQTRGKIKRIDFNKYGNSGIAPSIQQNLQDQQQINNQLNQSNNGQNYEYPVYQIGQDKQQQQHQSNLQSSTYQKPPSQLTVQMQPSQEQGQRPPSSPQTMQQLKKGQNRQALNNNNNISAVAQSMDQNKTNFETVKEFQGTQDSMPAQQSSEGAAENLQAVQQKEEQKKQGEVINTNNMTSFQGPNVQYQNNGQKQHLTMDQQPFRQSVLTKKFGESSYSDFNNSSIAASPPRKKFLANNNDISMNSSSMITPAKDYFGMPQNVPSGNKNNGMPFGNGAQFNNEDEEDDDEFDQGRSQFVIKAMNQPQPNNNTGDVNQVEEGQPVAINTVDEFFRPAFDPKNFSSDNDDEEEEANGFNDGEGDATGARDTFNQPINQAPKQRNMGFPNMNYLNPDIHGPPVQHNNTIYKQFDENNDNDIKKQREEFIDARENMPRNTFIKLFQAAQQMNQQEDGKDRTEENKAAADELQSIQFVDKNLQSTDTERQVFSPNNDEFEEKDENGQGIKIIYNPAKGKSKSLGRIEAQPNSSFNLQQMKENRRKRSVMGSNDGTSRANKHNMNSQQAHHLAYQQQQQHPYGKQRQLPPLTHQQQNNIHFELSTSASNKKQQQAAAAALRQNNKDSIIVQQQPNNIYLQQQQQQQQQQLTNSLFQNNNNSINQDTSQQQVYLTQEHGPHITVDPQFAKSLKSQRMQQIVSHHQKQMLDQNSDLSAVNFIQNFNHQQMDTMQQQNQYQQQQQQQHYNSQQHDGIRSQVFQNNYGGLKQNPSQSTNTNTVTPIPHNVSFGNMSSPVPNNKYHSSHYHYSNNQMDQHQANQNSSEMRIPPILKKQTEYLQHFDQSSYNTNNQSQVTGAAQQQPQTQASSYLQKMHQRIGKSYQSVPVGPSSKQSHHSGKAISQQSNNSGPVKAFGNDNLNQYLQMHPNDQNSMVKKKSVSKLHTKKQLMSPEPIQTMNQANNPQTTLTMTNKNQSQQQPQSSLITPKQQRAQIPQYQSEKVNKERGITNRSSSKPKDTNSSGSKDISADQEMTKIVDAFQRAIESGKQSQEILYLKKIRLHHEIFSKFSFNAFKLLIESCCLLNVTKNECLFLQGNRIQSVFFILSGTVSLCYSPTGSYYDVEQCRVEPHTVQEANKIIGEECFFNNNHQYKETAVCTSQQAYILQMQAGQLSQLGQRDFKEHGQSQMALQQDFKQLFETLHKVFLKKEEKRKRIPNYQDAPQKNIRGQKFNLF